MDPENFQRGGGSNLYIFRPRGKRKGVWKPQTCKHYLFEKQLQPCNTTPPLDPPLSFKFWNARLHVHCTSTMYWLGGRVFLSPCCWCKQNKDQFYSPKHLVPVVCWLKNMSINYKLIFIWTSIDLSTDLWVGQLFYQKKQNHSPRTCPRGMILIYIFIIIIV